MTNSNSSLSNQLETKSNQKPQKKYLKNNSSLRAVAYGWLIASFVGFLDAAYLTIEHFRNATPHCFLLKGCDIVTSSSYAILFGMPVALLGALYYCAILLLSFGYLDSENPRITKIIIPLTGAGFIASLYFVYLQAFVIRAACIYCIGSAATGTALFVLSLIALASRRPTCLNS